MQPKQFYYHNACYKLFYISHVPFLHLHADVHVVEVGAPTKPRVFKMCIKATHASIRAKNIIANDIHNNNYVM